VTGCTLNTTYTGLLSHLAPASRTTSVAERILITTC